MTLLTEAAVFLGWVFMTLLVVVIALGALGGVLTLFAVGWMWLKGELVVRRDECNADNPERKS